MGWYLPNAVWRRRASISVDIAGATPVDVDVTIPRDWDDFWDVIDSSGLELRAVWYDGTTVLAYSVDNGSGGAFDRTNRLGRIRIDGMTVPAVTAVLQIWLYYDSSTTQGSGAVATVMAASRNGYIELGRPAQHRFAHMPQTARSLKPRSIVHKTVNEQVFIWIRLDGALSKRSTPGNRSATHEEALYATMTVQNSSGVDQATMYDTDKIRFVWIARGEMWMRIRVKAGTTATFYTAVVLTRTILPAATTAEQQIETRIGIAVSDSLES
jgi:hypothetical protein